jgi:O-antigen/teichoic acid export membrane protein
LPTTPEPPGPAGPLPVAGGGGRAARTIHGATSVLGDFAAIAGSRFSYAFFAFFNVMMITRMLAPASYGTVATATVVSNLIYVISTVWTQPAVRRYGREDLELRGTMSRLTWNRALIAVPLTVLCVAVTIGMKLTGHLPADLTWFFVVLIVATALTRTMNDHQQSLLETSGRMKLSAAGNVLRQVLYIATLAFVYFFTSSRSAEVVVGLSIATLLVLIVLWTPVVWKTGFVPVEFDRTLLRRMLWLTIPIIGLSVGQYVIASVDIIVLRWFTTQAKVGVYAVAYQGYTVLQTPATSVTAVFLPLFVSLRLANRMDVVERYLARAVPQILLLASAGVGMGAAVLPVVVPLVFGRPFAAAAQPLAILLAALVLMFGAYLMAPILLLHEQTRWTASVTIIGSVINIVGDLLTVAVFHWGGIGPAVATVVSCAFILVGYAWRATGILGCRPMLSIVFALPLAIGITVALLFDSVLPAVGGVAVVGATTAAIIAWRRPFGPEDVELLDRLDVSPTVKRALTRGFYALGAR